MPMLSVVDQDTTRCIHCDHEVKVPEDTDKDPEDDDSPYARWQLFPEEHAKALFTEEELPSITGFYLCTNSRCCNNESKKNFRLESRIPSLRSNGAFKNISKLNIDKLKAEVAALREARKAALAEGPAAGETQAKAAKTVADEGTSAPAAAEAEAAAVAAEQAAQVAAAAAEKKQEELRADEAAVAAAAEKEQQEATPPPLPSPPLPFLPSLSYPMPQHTRSPAMMIGSGVGEAATLPSIFTHTATRHFKVDTADSYPPADGGVGPGLHIPGGSP